MVSSPATTIVSSMALHLRLPVVQRSNKRYYPLTNVVPLQFDSSELIAGQDTPRAAIVAKRNSL